MKTTDIISVILAILSVTLCVHWAEARGNYRFNLDQKWRQVQTEQERQERQWKSIEREAEGLEGKTDSAGDTIRLAPSGSRQGQNP